MELVEAKLVEPLGRPLTHTYQKLKCTNQPAPSFNSYLLSIYLLIIDTVLGTEDRAVNK